MNENTSIPELNLVRSGWNASYSSSTDSIDVFVFKASAQDWNQIEEDAKKAFEKLKNRGWFCSGSSCTFNRYTAGDADFFLVWNKQWLHVFSAMDLEKHRSFVNVLYKSTSNKED